MDPRSRMVDPCGASAAREKRLLTISIRGWWRLEPARQAICRAWARQRVAGHLQWSTRGACLHGAAPAQGRLHNRWTIIASRSMATAPSPPSAQALRPARVATPRAAFSWPRSNRSGPSRPCAPEPPGCSLPTGARNSRTWTSSRAAGHCGRRGQRWPKPRCCWSRRGIYLAASRASKRPAHKKRLRRRTGRSCATCVGRSRPDRSRLPARRSADHRIDRRSRRSPRSSNALRCVAGHCAMPLSAASLHHTGVMSTGISVPVVGGVVR